MEADWDAVPDFHLDGRSVVPYPDPDPVGTAAMWARLDALKVEAEPELEDDDETAVYAGYHPVIITQAAEEFDEPCRSLAGFVKLAHENDWEILDLSHALSTAKGKPYGSGQKEGVMRPDYAIDTQWAHFRKVGCGKVSICFSIINGETRGTRTARLFNGVQLSDADIKKVLKGTYVQAKREEEEAESG